ncbi:unnamed protein product [Plutella xylostella]|uniref:protein-tyrosine-phosphatase n=1 Tax=Plutella xylostella TaxID=51655 RepID=A0A8S4GCG4_PLUXY|nr:unnamed protein product [Plutella xylostella]
MSGRRAEIEKEGIEKLDILEVLMELRKDRAGLIQTPDQLRFSFQAVLEGHKRLAPDWVEPDAEDADEDEIYVDMSEMEAPAPPPPPRAGSLAAPPSKPLPPIPSTTSMGNLQYSAADGSSSDECAPPPPPARRPAPPPPPPGPEDMEPLLDSAETPPESLADVPSTSELRRRRTEDLAERVSAMKRKAKEADNWNSLKRSLYKPLTITFGVLIAGIVIYAYVKH